MNVSFEFLTKKKMKIVLPLHYTFVQRNARKRDAATRHNEAAREKGIIASKRDEEREIKK